MRGFLDALKAILPMAVLIVISYYTHMPREISNAVPVIGCLFLGITFAGLLATLWSFIIGPIFVVLGMFLGMALFRVDPFIDFALVHAKNFAVAIGVMLALSLVWFVIQSILYGIRVIVSKTIMRNWFTMMVSYIAFGCTVTYLWNNYTMEISLIIGLSIPIVILVSMSNAIRNNPWQFAKDFFDSVSVASRTKELMNKGHGALEAENLAVGEYERRKKWFK
uniref:hypothetical protein n=1 Tax=Thaumasiovibrio occultus TaxID=1891184 RepID=UPI000B34D07A|nr:hypothetical protein [Thaumasiovibrio occultus]